jgi:hypothetical protein
MRRLVAPAIAVAPFVATLPVVVVLMSAGCGGAAVNAGRPLPAYGGHAAELFDDGIEPLTVGYPSDQEGPPSADNRLRERTQVGDAVVRARVTTVNKVEGSGGLSWQLGMHTVEHLAGTGPLDADFTLLVASSAPAAGIVRAWEARLVGTQVIAFVREFAKQGAPPGEAGDLRFHVAPDSADEKKAVTSAVLLEQVR